MDMKRFFLYAIAIAALALAGCGGNGGGDDMTMMPQTPEPCPNGQERNAAGDCVAPTPPPPTREAPPMELVNGSWTANDDDHSATNPHPILM